jgi:hypothetical protein
LAKPLLPSCGIGAIFGVYETQHLQLLKGAKLMRKSRIDATLKRVEQLYMTPALDWDIIGGPLCRIIATARLGHNERLVVTMKRSRGDGDQTARSRQGFCHRGYHQPGTGRLIPRLINPAAAGFIFSHPSNSGAYLMHVLSLSQLKA